MAKTKIRSGMIFERHEKKYIVSAEQYRLLLDELEPYMQYDQYGLHTIMTIYYDTEDYSLIRHSLDKPTFKEKLRLRSYGQPDKNDLIYLELKKKLGGITYKRRMPITLQSANQYLEKGIVPEENIDDPQTFGEINWFIQQINVGPKVALSYERIALCGRTDADLRMTFDADIRWRDHHLDLSEGDYGSLLTEPDTRLLEIKTLGALPLWLCRLLSALKIYPVSFSKYGTVYSRYLMNQLKKEEVVNYAG